MKLSVKQWITMLEKAGITKKHLDNTNPAALVCTICHGPMVLPYQKVPLIIVPHDYELAPDGKIWTDQEWREIEAHYGFRNLSDRLELIR